MGSGYSQVENTSEWKVEFTLKKGTTTVGYTLLSETPLMTKSVKGQAGTSITFSVDPKDFQMMFNNDVAGTDGEADALRQALQGMNIVLKERFEPKVREESVVEEVEGAGVTDETVPIVEETEATKVIEEPVEEAPVATQ